MFMVKQLIEKHLIEKHLIEKHLIEKHLIEKHLIEKHLIKKHFFLSIWFNAFDLMHLIQNIWSKKHFIIKIIETFGVNFNFCFVIKIFVAVNHFQPSLIFVTQTRILALQ